MLTNYIYKKKKTKKQTSKHTSLFEENIQQHTYYLYNRRYNNAAGGIHIFLSHFCFLLT